MTLTTPNPTLTYPKDDVALLIQYLCHSFVMSLFRSVALLNGSQSYLLNITEHVTVVFSIFIL